MVDTSSLLAAASAFRVSLKRRLLVWSIRWAITFVIIAAIVHFNPTLAWLWWAGAALATISLALILGLHFWLGRRLASGQSRIAEYERMGAEAERRASHRGD